MSDDGQETTSTERAWQHIAAQRFDEAEPLVREGISAADPAAHSLLWHLFGLLASVLNSLRRRDEAHLMLRESLTQARAIGPDAKEIDVARYMLANHALLFGDPAEA